MKQIEKLTIDSAERNWDMANVRDMLYALIDAHNSQAGEEKEETCEICGKPLKKCGEIAKKRARDEEVKQDPIDVEECGHETEKRKGQCPTCVGEKYIMEGSKKLDVETLIGEVFDIGFDRGYRKETGVIGERYEEIIKVLKQAIRQ